MNAIYIACSLITLAYFIYLVVFYLGIGIIKCLMEKRYYMVLQNIFIIIVVLFPLGTERGKDSVLYFQLASVTFAENNINKNRRIGYGYLFKETFYKHCCFMRLYCWIIVGYYRT